LEKIKNENKKYQEKVDITKDTNETKKIKNAIHLDLTESEETSITNEFLFSFLIAKFYTNNETIIYIPKDIEIYIEIPNCFKNYFSQFGILNIFPRETIHMDNMPKLNLEEKTIEIFNRMIELNSNEEIEEKFIKKYMDSSKKYSYHQIIAFIKLFISQYSKFKTKIYFSSIKRDKNGKVIEKKDITEDCISDFAQSTKYFINSGFNQLLMKKIDE